MDGLEKSPSGRYQSPRLEEKKNKTTRQRAQHRSPTLMTAVRGMVGLRIKGLPRERYSAVGTHFAGLLLLQARFVPSFPLSIPTPILYVFHCRLRPRLFFVPSPPILSVLFDSFLALFPFCNSLFFSGILFFFFHFILISCCIVLSVCIPVQSSFECYFAHAVSVYLHAAAVLQLLLGTCLLSLSSVSVTSLSQPSLLNARYYQYLHTLLRSYTVMLLNTLTYSPPFAVPQLPPLPLPQPPPRLAISGSYFQRLLPTAEFRQHKITPVAV